MLGADVLVAEAFRFFRSAVQNALAFGAERHLDGRGDALANGDAGLDLFPNGLDGTLLAEEAVCQSFVLAHQAKQKVLGLDVRTAVLAGLIPRKENDTTRFFRISFKHD